LINGRFVISIFPIFLIFHIPINRDNNGANKSPDPKYPYATNINIISTLTKIKIEYNDIPLFLIAFWNILISKKIAKNDTNLAKKLQNVCAIRNTHPNNEPSNNIFLKYLIMKG
jgi:hypothetical protein